MAKEGLSESLGSPCAGSTTLGPWGRTVFLMHTPAPSSSSR